MTTIYVPTRIETAEHAETLPLGTIAYETDAEQGSIFVLTGESVWPWRAGNGPVVRSHDGMVGWTALVPHLAGEETRPDLPGRRGINPVRRYVSEWKDAT